MCANQWVVGGVVVELGFYGRSIQPGPAGSVMTTCAVVAHCTLMDILMTAYTSQLTLEEIPRRMAGSALKALMRFLQSETGGFCMIEMGDGTKMIATMTLRAIGWETPAMLILMAIGTIRMTFCESKRQRRFTLSAERSDRLWLLQFGMAIKTGQRPMSSREREGEALVLHSVNPGGAES